MQLKSLKLDNFRSYKNFNVDFKPGLNIFVGENAQGKTNLLESIYFCSIGKSTRTAREKELIRWGENKSKINLQVQREFNKSKIEIVLCETCKKTIKINEIPIKRMGELMGELLVIYFSPDEIRLIKDAPEDRRRFMDIDLSQMSKNYFYNLMRYEKILNQRNKLLKTTKSREVLRESLSIWDEQLAVAASKIIMSRIKFIERLKGPANEVHRFITEDAESLALSYQSTIINSKEIAVCEEEIKQRLLKAYEASIARDFDLGYTTVGPHRDDIKVVINGVDIRSYGSQGQQRLTTLSLKIAELEIFKQDTGETPVLLLDDVLSELDSHRQMRLLEKIKGIQTLITCTSYPYEVGESGQIVKIVKE